MNIAIMSHDNRKDLMVQFCTAYAGILSQHNLYATNTTGHMVAEATGLKVQNCTIRSFRLSCDIIAIFICRSPF